jgi:hypothetical protein
MKGYGTFFICADACCISSLMQLIDEVTYSTTDY